MKVLLSGAAAAAISGVLLGGAMQPHLAAADDRPAGPQMFANWSGARSTGPFDPATSFVAYQGRVPDYVNGTDWKKAMAWPAERAAVASPARDDEPPPEPPAAFTRAAYDASSPTPHAAYSPSDAEPSPEPATEDAPTGAG